MLDTGLTRNKHMHVLPMTWGEDGRTLMLTTKHTEHTNMQSPENVTHRTCTHRPSRYCPSSDVAFSTWVVAACAPVWAPSSHGA